MQIEMILKIHRCIDPHCYNDLSYNQLLVFCSKEFLVLPVHFSKLLIA